MLAPTEHPRVRFGKYEFDANTGELFMNGEAVKLQPQPVRVLDLLVSRAGRLVTRHEMREALWPDGTSVEFDQGLNYCIRQIRAALGESANEPTYLETLPKRGYRFIAPVIPVEKVPDAERPAEPQIEEPKRALAIRPRYGLIASGLIVATLAAITLPSPHWLPDRSETVPRSILVRPFVDQGLPAENAWYTDSMAQQLIGALARTKKVRVLPWSTSLSIQGQVISVRELGQRFGVDAVLEGYLGKSGEGLRLTVHLLNARTEKTDWTGQYDKEYSDFGRIEAEFMNSVSRTLQLRIQEEDTPSGRRPPDDIETYNLYLKAGAKRYQGSRSSTKASCDAYQEVIRRAPGFAPAYAELANLWARDPRLRGGPYKEALEKAAEYARHAIDLDSSGAEGHAALAHAYFRLKNPSEAEKEFRVALSLDPDSAVTLQLFAIHLALEGRFDEAIRRAKKAALLAPTSDHGYTIALVHLHAGNYDEAIASGRQVQEIDWRRTGGLAVASRAYAMKGMIPEAMEMQAKWEKLRLDPAVDRSMWRAYLIALGGDKKRAMAELAAWDARYGDPPARPFPYGLTLLECGEIERGFQAVRRSKHMWFKYAPELHKWRSHPQYAATAAYFERLRVE